MQKAQGRKEGEKEGRKGGPYVLQIKNKIKGNNETGGAGEYGEDIVSIIIS